MSYAVAGLACRLSGEVASAADLDSRKAAYFRDLYDVEVRTGVEVTRIDPRRRTVTAGGRAIPFDALIFAGGVGTVFPAGLAEGPGVHAFRNLADLHAVEAGLRTARRPAVVGGGPFGIEAADALARRGASAVLVERAPRLLPSWARAAAAAAERGLRAAGVEVLTGAGVAGVERRKGHVESLLLDDGRRVPCDLVIVTAGVAPRTALLAAAGARLLPSGAVRVDDRCRTSLPGVFACGTCIAPLHAVSGRPAWLPQAAIADRSAQVAGSAAAGGGERLGTVLGTVLLRAGAATVARTGVLPVEAHGALVTRVHGPSRDPFLPGAEPIHLVIRHDPRSGRLLAADAWGVAGVDKRIDVLATAMAGGLSVEDLARLDLGYSPPFATARDPVNVAGAVAAAVRAGLASSLSPAEVNARSGSLALYDLRTPAERREARIAGSRPVTLAALRADPGSLGVPRGRIPVFVSRHGKRGYLAVRIARARGFPRAAFLAGGIASWRAEGLPVEGRKP